MSVAQQERDTTNRSLAWVAAPLIGVVAIVGVMGSGAGFSVDDELPVNTMLDKLEDATSALLLVGAVQALAAMALVVFGAFAYRRIRAVEPDGALTSLVAFGGCVLTAATMAVSAMFTQLASGMGHDAVDPAVPLAVHTIEENLFAGSWCSLALLAGAIAVASLRHRVLPTWLGGVSAFFAILLLVLQLTVPWASWFVSAIFLIAAGIGLRPSGSSRRLGTV